MSTRATSDYLKQYMLEEIFADHNGAVCYHATDKSNGRNYVVKVYIIPTNDALTEAFLLCGAFPDIYSIRSYYKELARDLCRQAAILNALSHTDYFSHFTGCHIEETDNGYEVYLISPLQHTLSELFSKATLSEQNIIKLGIELCRATKQAREAGFLYIGLKPENIYISPKGIFQIGDVGFISVHSLPYAAMPDRYQTIYTPVDTHDCFGKIDMTTDIYGIGVILYQALSGGKQPQIVLGQPENKNQKLTEIVMKACSPAAANRWQDPYEMEQSLHFCLRALNSNENT